MKRRVAIVGTGWVGASVAISTLHSGVADELLLHDVREGVAEGEAHEIIRRKGVTNHAIGLATADLIRCILRDERRVLTVSRMQEGALGLRHVTLSLPTVVGSQGATEVLEPEISADERQCLEQSADVIRKAAVAANLS